MLCRRFARFCVICILKVMRVEFMVRGRRSRAAAAGASDSARVGGSWSRVCCRDGTVCERRPGGGCGVPVVVRVNARMAAGAMNTNGSLVPTRTAPWGIRLRFLAFRWLPGCTYRDAIGVPEAAGG
jgi:hypothetical protein